MKKKFLRDSHVKISGRNYCYARFWQKLLLLLQSAKTQPQCRNVPIFTSHATGNISEFTFKETDFELNQGMSTIMKPIWKVN